ncbi:energy transducer TonB [Parapedobacter koreensis]|uniref:Protein TonB n=1 Tax=Parapedobacter koreensis TaxID=332977 RepID=A0A1H7RPH8_9SPHI|nr:energy transducer TonB [Parapedobacter koreensis]SEL62092.1 protein TonB [Parapedobacter koreensis]
MYYPKQDIFSQNWLDIIFDGRNKQYGAYVLRRDASKNVNLALLIASSIFVVSLLAPLIKSRFFPNAASLTLAHPLDEGFVVELTPPPPIAPEMPEPPSAALPAPRTSQVRMPVPVVVNADRVTEEPPSIAVLQLANPSSQNVVGNPDAAIHIDLPTGNGKADAEVTESGAKDDTPFISVEIEPEFPGGMEAFLNYVRQNYRYPPQAVENGVKGRVVLQFVVERDGSLTGITVVRDLKFGTGEEAIRLLSASPKWNPGIQNGRPVRVVYTLPIGLAIAQ